MLSRVLGYAVIAVVAWWAWHGLWGWGPRLLVPGIPLLAGPLGPGADLDADPVGEFLHRGTHAFKIFGHGPDPVRFLYPKLAGIANFQASVELRAEHGEDHQGREHG